MFEQILSNAIEDLVNQKPSDAIKYFTRSLVRGIPSDEIAEEEDDVSSSSSDDERKPATRGSMGKEDYAPAIRQPENVVLPNSVLFRTCAPNLSELHAKLETLLSSTVDSDDASVDALETLCVINETYGRKRDATCIPHWVVQAVKRVRAKAVESGDPGLAMRCLLLLVWAARLTKRGSPEKVRSLLMATLVPLRPVLANVASKQIFVELLLATLTTLEKPIAASTPEATSRFAFVDIIYDLVKTQVSQEDKQALFPMIALAVCTDFRWLKQGGTEVPPPTFSEILQTRLGMPASTPGLYPYSEIWAGWYDLIMSRALELTKQSASIHAQDASKRADNERSTALIAQIGEVADPAYRLWFYSVLLCNKPAIIGSRLAMDRYITWVHLLDVDNIRKVMEDCEQMGSTFHIFRVKQIMLRGAPGHTLATMFEAGAATRFATWVKGVATSLSDIQEAIAVVILSVQGYCFGDQREPEGCTQMVSGIRKLLCNDLFLGNVLKRLNANEAIPLATKVELTTFAISNLPPFEETGTQFHCKTKRDLMQSVSAALDTFLRASSLELGGTVGKPVMDFTTMAWDKNRFRKLSLSDYRGKYVVLFFWPLDFTFVCPTEIQEYGDAAAQFVAECDGCVVLGGSTDSQYVHRAWTLKSRDVGGIGRMEIPLISDLSHEISKNLGNYIATGPDTGASLRATFIIDQNGILRHKLMNDLPVGRNIADTMATVKELQQKDAEVAEEKAAERQARAGHIKTLVTTLRLLSDVGSELAFKGLYSTMQSAVVGCVQEMSFAQVTSARYLTPEAVAALPAYSPTNKELAAQILLSDPHVRQVAISQVLTLAGQVTDAQARANLLLCLMRGSTACSGTQALLSQFAELVQRTADVRVTTLASLKRDTSKPVVDAVVKAISSHAKDVSFCSALAILRKLTSTTPQWKSLATEVLQAALDNSDTALQAAALGAIAKEDASGDLLELWTKVETELNNFRL